MLKIKRLFPLAALALCAPVILLSVVIFSVSCSRQTGKGSLKPANDLRFGLTTEPVTFDPLNPANTADGRSILFNVFEGLVKPDSSGGLIPAVAESYRVDGSTYVFVLRKGIQFHDGKEVKPADVAFSLLEAQKAHFPGFDKIAGIDISGPREIRIILTKPDPEFLPYLTVGIVPRNNPDREKKPVGTGPFIIKSYLPQQSLKLVRNPYYWHRGEPLLESVTIAFSSDTDSLLTGLKGGNIEGASVTGALIPQLDPNEFDIIPSNSNTVQLMALNNAQKPLDDVRVRRAINYAIDVQRIIETAFYGKGESSGSPLIPGLKNVYNESLRNPYPADLEKAKKLLAEAGYSKGFPLEIVVPSNYTMHVDTAQVIVHQLLDAGIVATIRLLDWGTWLSEVYRNRNYQSTIISLDANNVSPRSFLSRYLSDAKDNFINFNNPAYDKVYQAALVENDEKQRIALYKEAQQLISENAASVFIQDIVGFKVFTKGRFDGIKNYPLYIIDFASIYKK